MALGYSALDHECAITIDLPRAGRRTKALCLGSLQVLNGKEDALHLASQHTQAEENQRSMRGFLCPVQPPQSGDFQPLPAAGAGRFDKLVAINHLIMQACREGRSGLWNPPWDKTMSCSQWCMTRPTVSSWCQRHVHSLCLCTAATQPCLEVVHRGSPCQCACTGLVWGDEDLQLLPASSIWKVPVAMATPSCVRCRPAAGLRQAADCQLPPDAKQPYTAGTGPSGALSGSSAVQDRRHPESVRRRRNAGKACPGEASSACAACV